MPANIDYLPSCECIVLLLVKTVTDFVCLKKAVKVESGILQKSLLGKVVAVS